MVSSFHEKNNSLKSLFKADPWNDVSVHVQGLGFGSCSQALGWDGGVEGSGESLGSFTSPEAPPGPWGPTVLQEAPAHRIYPCAFLRSVQNIPV